MRIAFKSDVMGIAVLCEVLVWGELRVSEFMSFSLLCGINGFDESWQLLVEWQRLPFEWVSIS